MESIHKESDKIKGVEVLYFEQAELDKIKSNSTSYASIGPLSVLYFKDYHRFVLQLNDWRYPLLRRLSIIASDDINPDYRSYVLPAQNGFSYELKLSKANKEAIQNFETILHKNSKFSMEGQKAPEHTDMSPDDKVTRDSFNKLLEEGKPGVKEVVTGLLSGILDKIKVNVPGKENVVKGKNVKNRVILKDIKTKNFKKTAHSTLKKDFLEKYEKETHEFLEKRRDNPNMSELKGFETLHQTSDKVAPSLFVPRVEVVDAILKNKEMMAL